jgi:hypothetical protein
MRAFLLGLALSGLLAAPALACGPAAKGGAPIPPIASLLDEELPKVQLADADLAKVRELRAKIATLVAAKKTDQARDVEEEAMAILGYRKALLRCGPGTFLWMKVG